MATRRSAKGKKQYLPLTVSTFSNFVEENCIYVDKTRYILPLVQPGRCLFLITPQALSGNP
jgi:hypothetical protein